MINLSFKNHGIKSVITCIYSTDLTNTMANATLQSLCRTVQLQFFLWTWDWWMVEVCKIHYVHANDWLLLKCYTCISIKFMQCKSLNIHKTGRRYRNNDFVNGEKPFIPLEIFTVEPMKWYRFRIINVGFAQPFQISFEAVSIMSQSHS